VISFQSAVDQFFPPSFGLPEYKSPTDPRDHTNLKEAWDEMIRKRCLTPRATSVLPTYLPMAFANVKSLKTIQIPLPPNSPAQQSNVYWTPVSTPNGQERFNPDAYFDMSFRPSNTTGQDKAPFSSASETSKRTSSSWASMHLARTVHTIIGCKEAIWDAYQDLFSNKFLAPPVVQSSRVKDIRDADNTKGLRDVFENDWLRWEGDMKDRIGIRGCIGAELMWSEPPGPLPDWRVWRDSLEMQREDDEFTLVDRDMDICRSIRGFVCWKPELGMSDN